MNHSELSDPQHGITILEDMVTPFGRIQIYQSAKDGSRTFYQDACFHSRADANGQSLIAYIHAMYGVLLQARAHDIAVLGCAGGTLATMLALAGCKVTVVDINPHAFELAKRYFNLPDSVECVVDDARLFLEHTDAQFDGIAIDVFAGGVIPPHLRNVEFFRVASGRLRPGGVIVANVIIDHDLDLLADHIAAGMTEATGLPVALFDEMQQPDRNIVIVAGALSAVLPRGTEPESIRRELEQMKMREVRRQAVAYREGQ